MNVPSATESQKPCINLQSKQQATEKKKPEIAIIDAGYVLPLPSFNHVKIVDRWDKKRTV